MYNIYKYLISYITCLRTKSTSSKGMTESKKCPQFSSMLCAMMTNSLYSSSQIDRTTIQCENLIGKRVQEKKIFSCEHSCKTIFLFIRKSCLNERKKLTFQMSEPPVVGFLISYKVQTESFILNTQSLIQSQPVATGIDIARD